MSNATEPPQPGRITGAYAGLVFIWSTTPLSVVLSLRDFDAVWALTLRMLAAALLASLILKCSGSRLATDRDALKLYGIGSLAMFGAMLLTYLGARHLPSGMISVLFGLAPLMVGLMSQWILRDEPALSRLQWAGLVMALVGLAVIFLDKEALVSLHGPSVLMVLGGVFSYAVSALGLKRSRKSLPPLVQTTGALWLSALACVLVLPVLGGAVPDHWPAPVTLLALSYTILFGSIIAMLCYFFLLQHLPVGTMALTTLMTPVLALLLGVFINHERFHVSVLWGVGLILFGLLVYYESEWRHKLPWRRALIAP